MKKIDLYIQRIKNHLKQLSSADKAKSSRRYFPAGIDCIGVTAADIKAIIADFHLENSELTALEVLSVSESLLEQAEFSEETLVAFGLINKLVKHNYDERLLLRFEFWLEHYATNWSHVDDLCIKTIYQFLLTRPHLIEQTQHWAHSKVSWCRRASNVVWVKFIKRRVGRSVYCLDKVLVFNNCDLLMQDKDDYVQKSIGWLLKVTSVHHLHDVIEYIEENASILTRPTIRYAIEKMDVDTRKRLLSIKLNGIHLSGN